MDPMHDLLDLQRYPLDRPGSPDWARLVARSAGSLRETGMFDLEDLLRPGVAARSAAAIAPVMRAGSFEHRRRHNIYFRPSVPGLDPDHPSLRLLETVSHTLCADQLGDSPVMALYEYEPLRRFLAAAMGKPALHAMQDPLARANVMSYRDGEALNWHFDRSEFTVTLLLQAPDGGGDFQYRSDLRSERDPNHDGVVSLLDGRDRDVRTLRLRPGTLNVFRGRNTAHRVTPVRGERERVVAVLSYYETPGVMFSDEERVGFYGRAG